MWSERPQVGPAAVVAGLATVAALALGGCSSTAKELGESAFVKLVNVKCKAEKEQLAFALEVGDLLGVDDRARAEAAKVRAATERFRVTVAKLHGPAALRDEITAVAAAAKDLPAQVAAGTITPDEAKTRLRELQARLERRGLGECVHR